MKVIFQTKPLTEAFMQVASVAPSRTSKDILKSVLIQIESGKATLIASDSEIGIRCELPIESSESISALLPVSKVLSILKECQSDQVSMDITDKFIDIKCGTSKFKLSGQDPAGFPPVSIFDATDYYVTNAGVFRHQIKQTIFAVDASNTTFNLGGVRLEPRPDVMALVATDSRRLAVSKGPMKTVGSPPMESFAIFPTKALSLIEKILGDGTGEVQIAIKDNQAVVRCGLSTVVTQLIAGMFPKYERMLRDKSDVKLDISVAPFFSAIRQSMIVTNEESSGVNFTFENGNMRLESFGSSVGESDIEMPISYDGEKVRYRLQPAYLCDFLRTFDTGAQIELHMNKNDPDPEATIDVVIFVCGTYTYMIAPMEIEDVSEPAEETSKKAKTSQKTADV